MNITMFSEVSTNRVIGGAERVLREQALRLGRSGHQVHVITRSAPGDDRTEVTVEGVEEGRVCVFDAR
jgi:NAD(P)-dependent dehydrogenase (short-subunit alcohol dehydrogenase family)